MTGSELLEFALELARRARVLLEADGLTIRQYHALGSLAERPLRVGELARLLEIRTPSTVTLVDGLVARGFARREPDAADGRVSLVGLTPAGSRALAEAEQRLVEAFDELAANLETATR
jgi:DNA-binding MarR family transcriptional regulator